MLMPATATDEPPERLSSCTYAKIVIDENKTHGILLFRSAHNSGTILVHDSVKQTIESLGIDTLEFIDKVIDYPYNCDAAQLF
jgi:hypothetical protein